MPDARVRGTGCTFIEQNRPGGPLKRPAGRAQSIVPEPARLLLYGPGMKPLAFAAAVLSFVVLGGSGVPTAFAEGQGQAETGCPTYRSELLDARASLTRGDRAGAIAALRRALETVDTCLEATQGGGRVASRERELQK